MVDVSLQPRLSLLHSLVDGYFSEWSAWSACSRSCGGGGIYTRTRVCVSPQSGGRNCPAGDLAQTQTCMPQSCPIDGAWYSWSIWSSCSATCGLSVRTRERNCQQPQFGGNPCPGDSVETLSCETTVECPVNCQLSAWSVWSACPVTCGDSVRSRSRSIALVASNGGADCAPSDMQEVEACSAGDCGLPGQWTDWSAWSECNRTCGGGLRQRVRNCASQNASRPTLPCANFSGESSSAVATTCHEYPCEPLQPNCAAWAKLGLQDSTVVAIRPTAGVVATVYCNISDNSTTLGHSRQNNETMVHGFEPPGSYQLALNYSGGFAAGSALAADAKRCQQFLRLRCQNSMRTLAAATGEVMTWWNNRLGKKMTSWGSVPNNLTMCSCGYVNKCSQPNYLCNCDGPSADWAEDSGYVQDAGMLPVHSVQVGDTGNPNEFVAVLIGPLVCWH